MFDNQENPGTTRRRFRGRFLFFVPLAIAGVALLGLLVQWLWNSILTPVLGVGTLTYWQALGLWLLSRLLFGGFGPGRRGGRKQWGRRSWGPPPHLRERWMQMSDEERSRFKEEWRERCRSWRRKD